MSRSGVAILREIAMVKSSAPANVRTRMLADLHAELEALYLVDDGQAKLALEPGTDTTSADRQGGAKRIARP